MKIWLIFELRAWSFVRFTIYRYRRNGYSAVQVKYAVNPLFNISDRVYCRRQTVAELRSSIKKTLMLDEPNGRLKSDRAAVLHSNRKKRFRATDLAGGWKPINVTRRAAHRNLITKDGLPETRMSKTILSGYWYRISSSKIANADQIRILTWVSMWKWNWPPISSDPCSLFGAASMAFLAFPITRSGTLG